MTTPTPRPAKRMVDSTEAMQATAADPSCRARRHEATEHNNPTTIARARVASLTSSPMCQSQATRRPFLVVAQLTGL